MTWTSRASFAVAVALVLMAVETSYFGAFPGADQNLAATAVALAFVAFFALDGSALSATVGAASALVMLYVDQATLGLGVPAAIVTLNGQFWLDPILRSAATWAAFPLVTSVIGRRVPVPFRGIAAGLALATLPLIRYDDPGLVIGALLHSTPDGGLVLRIPWFTLCAIVAALLTGVELATRRWDRPRERVAIALIAVAGVFAASGFVWDDLNLRQGVVLSTSHGGALTDIEARSRLDGGAAVALWDGQPASPAPGQPARPFLSRGVATMHLLPGAQSDLQPGRHTVSLLAGLENRSAAFDLDPPTGTLRIEVSGTVVVSGPAGKRVQLLVIGDRGNELIEFSLDDGGRWSSFRELPPGHYRVVAAVAEQWIAIEVDR